MSFFHLIAVVLLLFHIVIIQILDAQIQANQNTIFLVLWLVVEAGLNGQRHKPGWIQLRHDKSQDCKMERNSLQKDNNKPKKLI